MVLSVAFLCNIQYDCLYIQLLCNDNTKNLFKKLHNFLLSEITCPPGQTYSGCVDPCHHTCRDLAEADDLDICSTPCVEGCTCPDGQVLNDDLECVDSRLCPCFFDGREFAAGAVTLQGADKW